MSYCEWGSLFGLSPVDLTDEQLRKMHFAKLLEFVDLDVRIENILCEKIKFIPSDEFRKIRECKVLNRANFPNFAHAYNDRLRSLSKEERESIDSRYYYRNEYIIWELLDDDLRFVELENWSKEKSSVINEETIDYNWIYQHNKVLATTMVDNLLGKNKVSSGYGSYTRRRTLKHLIANIPDFEVTRVFSQLNQGDKEVFSYVLSNPHCPDNYMVDALRIVAKRRYCPPVMAKITEDVLRKLPPITRLEALENVVHSTESIIDDNQNSPLESISEDKIRELLFSAITKHPSRVEHLIKRMKSKEFIK